MTNEERKLLDKLSSMEFEEYEKELNNLLENYNFDNCSEDFDAEFRNLMGTKYLGDDPTDIISFEDALQRTFDSWTEEERQAYLNEDWSEFDNV